MRYGNESAAPVTAVVGDVIGKGPEAAKFTALDRYTLRAARCATPSTNLATLNAALLGRHTDDATTAGVRPILDGLGPGLPSSPRGHTALSSGRRADHQIRRQLGRSPAGSPDEPNRHAGDLG
ncbi:SpoIIE family protein phosphatase [Actinoplanes awajinensis]|uniref:SpoIIE family protein phosphatase n=1 Tax=Actinoplanes awajinensis TaxID=135946 RepID=UPI000ADAE564